MAKTMGREEVTAVILGRRELALLISATGIYAQGERDVLAAHSFSEEAAQKIQGRVNDLLSLRAKLDEVKDRVYGIF